MRAKQVLPFAGVFCALLIGLAMGWLSLLLTPGASGAAEAFTGRHPGDHAAQAPIDRLQSGNAPDRISTPARPDLVGQVTWDGRWNCPYPVLRLTSTNNEITPCLGHIGYIVHLENSHGDSRNFTTGSTHGNATVECQLGYDIPFDWLQAMPFTLTVDYNNIIAESNESNNTATINTPPPMPTACASATVPPTPTALPPSTPTPTCTPVPPGVWMPVNLTGSMSWGDETCPIPILKLRTTLTGSQYICNIATPSHMRLTNSAGEHLDFAVSPLRGATAFEELDCPVGSCIPGSWLALFPLTLMVDALNEVPEKWGGRENDNYSQLSTRPPCGDATPTLSPTATPACCANVTAGTSSVLCLPTHYYYYSHNINNGCSVPTTGNFSEYLEVSANQGGPWTQLMPPQTFTQTLQPGSNSVAGSFFVLPDPPGQYNWYRMRLAGTALDNCWTVAAIGGPAVVCREATPRPSMTPATTPTYTPTPTLTVGPPCGILTFGQSAWCVPPPAMFHYLFVFYAESGCPGQMAGNGTLTFEVATTSNGPWVTYDQHTSQVTFQRTYNSVEGSLEEPGIPAKYGWYRFTYHASFPNNVNANGVTSAVQMCQAQTTTTPEVTPTITPASSSTPCTVSFSDVHPSDYFYQAVQYLGSHCAISGYADGTFRPFNNMTRGQVCKVVVLAFQIPLDTEGGPHFTDVPPSNPFYVYIETLYNRGIISGYADGTFRPYNNVTRGQFVKIICLVLGWPPADPAVPHFTDVPRGSPFYGYVEAATCGGLITGYSDGTFRPNSSITRGQVSQIIYRALMGASPCPTPTASP